MGIVPILDQTQWNDFLLSQPTQAGSFLQSCEWGEFQKSVGRRVYRFAAGKDFAQVIELPLPFKKKYWFIPRGTLIEGLAEKAREAGALFIRFEPLRALHATRYTLHVTKPISPAQTLLVDLSGAEEELLAAMHEKTRYNIRLALRKGVEIREGTFEEFWKLMQETAKRDGFRTHPKEYYEKMLEVLTEQKNLRTEELKNNRVHQSMGSSVLTLKLHMAYHGITPVAGAIVGYFGDTATYLHGASAHEHRSLMAPYALHWEIMKEAKKAGYKFYDFWGVNTKGKNWAGITRFKMGFGGSIVDYLGTFDFPLDRTKYLLYRLARRFR